MEYRGPALECIAVLAAAVDPIKEDAELDWGSKHEEAKTRLLAKAHPSQNEQRRITRSLSTSGFRPGSGLIRAATLCGAVAALLLLSLSVAYQFGFRRGHRGRANSNLESSIETSLSSQLQVLKIERDSLRGQLRADQTSIDSLTGRVQQRESELNQVNSAKNEIDHRAEQLNTQNQEQAASLLALATERNLLSERLTDSEKSLKDVRDELNTKKEQHQEAILRAASLERDIDQLSMQLRERDETVAEQQQLLAPDRDIRELMGARELYIAEVYDVEHSGTRKPFGRVFFTKNKSLIFYAYDLDQQPGVTNASAFQVWGCHGADRKRAMNLGIFYMDQANDKRWVLKVDDPKTLKQIDSVFVSVEPNGGSPKPGGNQLLFAYLRMEPNHP